MSFDEIARAWFSSLVAKKIELREGLPRYKDQDVDFVVQELPSIQPCSIPDFVKKAGFDPRPHGSPSAAYARILAAFHKGESEGRIEQRNGNRHQWCVATQVARAS